MATNPHYRVLKLNMTANNNFDDAALAPLAPDVYSTPGELAENQYPAVVAHAALTAGGRIVMPDSRMWQLREINLALGDATAWSFTKRVLAADGVTPVDGLIEDQTTITSASGYKNFGNTGPVFNKDDILVIVTSGGTSARAVELLFTRG